MAFDAPVPGSVHYEAQGWWGYWFPEQELRGRGRCRAEGSRGPGRAGGGDRRPGVRSRRSPGEPESRCRIQDGWDAACIERVIVRGDPGHRRRSGAASSFSPLPIGGTSVVAGVSGAQQADQPAGQARRHEGDRAASRSTGTASHRFGAGRRPGRAAAPGHTGHAKLLGSIPRRGWAGARRC